MAALALKTRPPSPAKTGRGTTLQTANRRHRRLLIAATLLAFFVVGLGAYVRLSDAGLGCPDWPGCYGQLIGVPTAAHDIAATAQAYPDQTVHTGKAWKEMAHRYAAGILGLLVFAIALSAWHRQRRRRVPGAGRLTPENALLVLIVLQAALGMWTVTLLLKPVIVTLHLLGGMATWAMLIHLLRREQAPQGPPLSAFGRLAVIVVFMQIALGGWVSSNYAALACNQFPTCLHGEWWPATDFGHGFTLLRELGATASGEALPFTALTAIHLTHRLGALLVLLVVSAYGLRCWEHSARSGNLILGALAVQVSFGIANVLMQLPLPLAVAHNLGAAGVLGVLVWGTSERQ